MEQEETQQLNKINTTLESLNKFIRENLVTTQELDDRFAKIASKEDMNQLTTAVDAYAKLA
jgi:hypothetical protein